jgi:hypothetical protein
MPAPSPHEQIEFLARIQRLLREGKFTATYKFALLRALADLSVELGDDSGTSLSIPTRLITDKFIQYYWNQVNPYPTGGEKEAVLLQNRTGQAEIITAITRFKGRHGQNLARVRRTATAWNPLVRAVDEKIREMPIPRLQEMGGGIDPFLYDQVETPAPSAITINPGVAFCLRRFHGLIIGLIEGEWARWIQGHGRNLPILGHTFDLHSFLFGQERQSLQALRDFFRDTARGRCFYCQSEVRGEGDLDHFVSWSRYPVDLGHNFVFAHPKCNLSKRDMLAAGDHLGHWVERNQAYDGEIEDFCAGRGVTGDLEASVKVASWAYQQAQVNRESVWVSVDERPILLEPYWQRHLPPAASLAAE